MQQAGGLTIDGSAGNYLSQEIGVAGPGPSTSAQMDEAMVCEHGLCCVNVLMNSQGR